MARSRDPKIDPNQYALDFESSGSERRALLAGALVAAGATRLQQLALLVHGHQEAHGQPLEMSVPEIAAELQVHRNTATRWIASLVRRHILSQELRAGETSRLQIDWQGVRTSATSRRVRRGAEADPDEPRSPSNEVGPWSHQVTPGHTRSHQVTPSAETSSSSLTQIETPPSYLPTPHQAAPYRVEELGAGWREVGRFLLRKWKIGLAAQAIVRFQAAGGSLAELTAIVAHADAHGAGTAHAAWGPGAVYRKIRDFEIGQPVDVGWPKPAEVYDRHQRRREDAQRARAAQQQIARQRAQQAATPPDGPSLLEQLRAELRAKHESSGSTSEVREGRLHGPEREVPQAAAARGNAR